MAGTIEILVHDAARAANIDIFILLTTCADIYIFLRLILHTGLQCLLCSDPSLMYLMSGSLVHTYCPTSPTLLVTHH